MRMTRLLALALANLAWAAVVVDSWAAQSWQQLKKAGQVAEVGGEYVHACEYYTSALKLVPSQDESSVVELEALLAGSLVHRMQLPQAALLTKHILKTVPRLKAANRLDPEVLVDVKYLSDNYNFSGPSSLSMQQRKKLFNQCEEFSLALNELVTRSEAENIAFRFDRSRSHVYFGQPDQAVKVLHQISAKMKPSSPNYKDVQLAEAAVLWSLHKPELMNKLIVEMTAKTDEVEVLRQVAEAHFYAANYDQIDKTLDKALVLLSKKKTPNITQEIEINRLKSRSYVDRNLWSKAEVHTRRIIGLLQNKKNSDQYNTTVNHLVFLLKKQNKTKEAKAMEARAQGNYNWLIDDVKKNPGFK